MSKTDVVKVEAVGGLTQYDAAMAELYGATGAGAENIGKEDVALPFLKILQGLSPEVTRGNEKFIKGAETGQYINSLTGELWDGEQGLEIIRVYFEKKYIEWRPKKAGGGLVRISDTEAEAKQHKTPDTGDKDVDTVIDETHQTYALVKGPTGWNPVLFSASRTKLPFMRKWNGLVINTKAGDLKDDVNAAKLPPNVQLKPFAVVYQLITVTKQNEKGTFFIPSLGKTKRLATASEFKAAAEFYEIIKKGAVKVEYVEPEATDAETVPGADYVGG
jgi:hypothetical protein